MNVVDFDAFRREQDAEQKFFKIGGKSYPMASQIPAILILKVLRLQAEQGADADVGIDMLEDFGRTVFGTRVWDEILIEHAIGIGELPMMIQAIIAAYTPKAEGESQTSGAKASSSPSSKAGRGSKRTSSGSID